MGREVKRVPLDFSWPQGAVWGGYINPHGCMSAKCPHCAGSGNSPEAQRLHDLWYGKIPFKPEERGSTPLKPTDAHVMRLAQNNVSGSPSYYGSGRDAVSREAARLAKMWNGQWCHHINADDVAALVSSGRLMELTHTFISGKGWEPIVPAYTPTPEEVNIWSLSGLGHDSINSWVCIKAECERNALPLHCLHCEGDGSIWTSKEAREAYDGWEEMEPPSGDGWQMWSTTSEGHPMSPVFATPEELAQWLADTGASSFGNDTATYGVWLSMISGDGWAPSAVSLGGGPIISGVEAASRR